MSFLLPADCLNEIFEHLEEDKITLHSCLLVNRLWCEISARILWRNIWNFKYSVAYTNQSRVSSAILSTLIACLPNESRELLYKNKVSISTPTSKPPLFNYAAFCKVLSIYEISRIINTVLIINESSITDSLRNCLAAEEIIKMFMNQISSLKKLTYHLNMSIPSLTCFPNARDYLVNLSELCCSSNIHSKFFYQLSQICHNLQSISIDFEDFEISNELKELISLQNNLKNLNLLAYDGNDWTNIVPTLTKHSNTLKKLHLYSDNESLLSFVASFPNLQEIKFSFIEEINSEDFKKLQNVIFPKLRILKFPYQCPKPEYVTKFLESNGKHLEEFYIYDTNNALKLSVIKFCPNLKKISLIFNNGELDILETIFNSCQHLESIEIWCGLEYLSEKEILETVKSHSPVNFHELKIFYESAKSSSEDLESFFISWKNRASKKLLTLIIINDYGISSNEENIKIIEKYKNLGVIKNFEIKEFGYEEEKEENDVYK